MLDFLARLLGPDRAVSAYVFVSRFGIAILCGLGFLAVIAFLFLRPTGEPEHEAYLTLPVVSSGPLSASDQHAVMVVVQLPDGENLRLTETEGLIARSIADTACVELRRMPRSGEARYRLRQPHRCEGSQ